MQEKTEKILAFLNAIEPLKTVIRHSWCSDGRRESVAEHCWRMAVLAFLVADEFPDVDMHKVIEMCLLHDLGEIEGDIPAFEKQDTDDAVESEQVQKLVQFVRPTFLDDTPHGIYASRHPCRPNGIGMSIVQLEKVHENILEVSGIDVLDGTPLLDIKPYIPKFDIIDSASNGWVGNKAWRSKPSDRE